MHAAPFLSTWIVVSWFILQEGKGPVTYKVARWRRRTADLDMILITGSRLRWDEAAALTGREEEIVETAIFVQIRALDGMVSSRFIRKVVRVRNRLFCGRIHLDLVDAPPERAKGHVKGAAVIEEIGIDGVVVVGGGRFNARRAMVRPGSLSHRVGRRQANGRVLRARGGHGIVQVIDPIDIPEIGCLADGNRISMEVWKSISRHLCISSAAHGRDRSDGQEQPSSTD